MQSKQSFHDAGCLDRKLKPGRKAILTGRGCSKSGWGIWTVLLQVWMGMIYVMCWFLFFSFVFFFVFIMVPYLVKGYVHIIPLPSEIPKLRAELLPDVCHMCREVWLHMNPCWLQCFGLLNNGFSVFETSHLSNDRPGSSVILCFGPGTLCPSDLESGQAKCAIEEWLAFLLCILPWLNVILHYALNLHIKLPWLVSSVVNLKPMFCKLNIDLV